MLQDVIGLDSTLAKVWVMPVIQGYVEIKQCKTFFKENEKYEVSMPPNRFLKICSQFFKNPQNFQKSFF